MKLFGKKKKKSTVSQAVGELKSVEDTLQKKEDHLQNRILNEENEIKRLSKYGDKSSALKALKRKKRFE